MFDVDDSDLDLNGKLYLNGKLDLNAVFMNNIQSEDKFKWGVCEVCSNTEECTKTHFDKEECADEDIEGLIDGFYRKRVNLTTKLLRR